MMDPGVPNWMDPAGLPVGAALWRWYKATACPIPTVTKVKLAELRRYLPKDTPFVTPQQRQAEMQVRTAAARRRWGQ